MTPKIKLIVITGFAIVLTLLGAAAFFLYGAHGRFSETDGEYRSARSQLESYFKRKPFPSLDNVAIEKMNAAMIQSNAYGRLAERLAQGQIEPEYRSPGKFKDLLRDTHSRLEKTATQNEVELPGNFAFGFEQYQGAELPAPSDVDRLSQQTRIVEELCDILFTARIRSLKEIERRVFESSGEASATLDSRLLSRRGAARASSAPVADPKSAGLLKEGDLFAKMRFTLVFTAKESALIDVLNRLASHEMMIIPTHLECRNEGTGVSVDRALQVESGEQETVRRSGSTVVLPSRKPVKQIVSGTERPMNVRLVVDVYRFRKPEGA